MSVLSKERLIEATDTYNQCNDKECKLGYCDRECEHYKSMVDKLAEYEDLEEQGLLFRLPCKPGDDLYWIASEDDDGNEKPTIRKYENGIKHITITENGIWVNAEDEAPTELDILGGEYALLTYEEAEEKLRELEGK